MPSLAPSALASDVLETTVASLSAEHNRQAILLGLTVAAIPLFLFFIGLAIYLIFYSSKNENGKNGSSVSWSTRFSSMMFKSQQNDLEEGTKPRKIRTSDISKPKLLFGTGPFAVNFTDSNSWQTSNDGTTTDDKVDDISNPFIAGDDDNEDGDGFKRSTWMTPADSTAEIVSPDCVKAIVAGAVECRQPMLEGVYRPCSGHIEEHAAKRLVEDSVETTEHIARHDTGHGHIMEHSVGHIVDSAAQHKGKHDPLHTKGLPISNGSTQAIGSVTSDDENTKECSDNDKPTESLRDSLCDIITADLISEIDELASHFRELELAFPDEGDSSGDGYDDQCLSDSSSLFGFDMLNTNSPSVTSVESDTVGFYKTPRQGVIRPACTDSRIKQEALERLCSSRIKMQRSPDLRFVIPLPFTRDPSTYNRATTPPYSCYVPFLPDNTKTPELEQKLKQQRDNKPLISSPLESHPYAKKTRSRRLREALLPQSVSSKEDLTDCANTTPSSHFVKKKPSQGLRVRVHKYNITRRGLIDSMLVNLTGVNPFADCYAYQSPFEDPVIIHPGMPACVPAPRLRTVVGPMARRETVAFKTADTASNSRYVRRESVPRANHHYQTDSIRTISNLGTSTGTSSQEPPVTLEDDDLLPPFPLPFTIHESPPLGIPLDTPPDEVATTSNHNVKIAKRQQSPGKLAYGFPSPPISVEDHLRRAYSMTKRHENLKESRPHRSKASTNETIGKQQPSPQSTMPITTTTAHTERSRNLNISSQCSPPKSTKESCRRNRGLSDVTNKKPTLTPSRRPRPSPSTPPLSTRVAPSRHSRNPSSSLTTNENLNLQKRPASTRASSDLASTRASTPNRSPTKGHKTRSQPKMAFRV